MTDSASTILLAAVESAALTADERRFFLEEAPSGVTIFARNIPSRFSETASLVEALQATRPAGAPPLMIAVDQEGGRVSRFKPPFPNLGPALKLAEGKDDAVALAGIENYGLILGAALAGLGVNVNFAPVLDLDTEPTNVAIGDRCFSTQPAEAARRAGAFLVGQQKAGVLGCLKHFPGQGDAKVDTHIEGTVIDLPRAVLEAREIESFRPLIAAAPMVMLAHVTYPALSAEPASRSKEIIEGLLRGRLGFTGVAVSDDMNMGAVPQDEAAWQQALVATVAAGADLLLVCRHLSRCRLALEGLRREAQRSQVFTRRLDEAAARVTALRRRLLPARIGLNTAHS